MEILPTAEMLPLDLCQSFSLSAPLGAFGASTLPLHIISGYATGVHCTPEFDGPSHLTPVCVYIGTHVRRVGGVDGGGGDVIMQLLLTSDRGDRFYTEDNVSMTLG